MRVPCSISDYAEVPHEPAVFEDEAWDFFENGGLKDARRLCIDVNVLIDAACNGDSSSDWTTAHASCCWRCFYSR